MECSPQGPVTDQFRREVLGACLRELFRQGKLTAQQLDEGFRLLSGGVRTTDEPGPEGWQV